MTRVACDAPPRDPPGCSSADAVDRLHVPQHEPDLAGVRWLALRVLPRDPSGLTRDMPVPRLVSAHPKPSTRAVRDYVLWWIRHPAPGGAFEAQTRWLHRLPGSLLVRLLLARRYDGLIYSRGETIIGHVFFQRHGDALHGFSTAVNEDLDGEGYSVVMMLDYVALGAQMPGVSRARVGRGRNNATRRLLARLKKHEDALGWRVSADGWVTFSARG